MSKSQVFNSNPICPVPGLRSVSGWASWLVGLTKGDSANRLTMHLITFGELQAVDTFLAISRKAGHVP